jgi:AcrR family transcriptional regulator
MSTNRPRSSARERLLDAAEKDVCEHGVHELTLEAVAAAAGVTKGGLIYHFKTKEDLLSALVERMMAKLREKYSARMAASDQTTRGVLVALVDDTFEMSAQDKAVLSSLLAAISSYPHLLAPVRDLFDDVYSRVGKGRGNSGGALAIAAALDGMVLLELLDLHHFTKPQRIAMQRALHAMAEGLA